MRKKTIIGYLISIAIAELVGFLSGLLAGNTGEVYRALTLPPLSPPGWVFPVVWVLLYATMGIAAYWVWVSTAERPSEKKHALTLYIIQLLVNFLWSIVFFRFEQYGLAVMIILLLDALVIATIRSFTKISRPAALILLPYMAWILFATYLTIGVTLLN